MNQKNCDLIRDLLPLYAEDMCSEESRQTVAAHLAECAECNAMLRKMNTEIHVKADDDIAVIKRIKRRIRIEKTVIAGVVTVALLIVLYLLFFILLNTPQEMDYNRYGFADTVRAELDENGDLWLVCDGLSKTADMVQTTVSDAEGNHFGGEGFDKAQKCGIGKTLYQRKIDTFAYADMTDGEPERTLICNINEKPWVEYVYYYEATTNTEHVLWERSAS
ncbi:MAG TPA: hypothetical protein DCG49_07440 [Ruminococcus sp.]|nr:hypothetical protein [Ruminococcus sp.]